MGHLSTFERMRVISTFNEFIQAGGSKFEKVSQLCKAKGIEISALGVRGIIEKWIKTSRLIFLTLKSTISLIITEIFQNRSPTFQKRMATNF